MKDESIFETVDMLASEYGWSIEYIENLQLKEINSLKEAILKRKINEYKVMCYITNCAFVGKQPQFNNEPGDKLDGQTEEEQLFRLMKKLGGKVEKR